MERRVPPRVALLAGLAALVLPAFALATDFGDAPDGGATTYKSGARVGAFPSLAASDGARATDIGTARLGPRADDDDDSKQVNRDRHDDGVSLRLAACGKSTAAFVIETPAGASTTGTAYLNLWADWNQDGKWSGSDGCASEWAIKNVPVNLAKVAPRGVVQVTFRGGRNVKELWRRATLSVSEKLSAPKGAFAKGEVEDGLVRASPASRATCLPASVAHGKSVFVPIVADPGSSEINDVKGNASTPAKKVVTRVKPPGFTYTSKHVDGPKRVVHDIVTVKVVFSDGDVAVLKCSVYVRHTLVVTPPCFPNATTSFTSTTFTTSGGTRLTTVVTRLNLGTKSPDGVDCEIVSLSLSGLGQGTLTVPGRAYLGPKDDRTTPEWTCNTTAPGKVACSGTDAIPAATDATIEFGMRDAPEPLDELTITLSGRSGKTQTLTSRRG